MAKVTGYKCINDNGESVLCDASGNNAALQCPKCGAPVLVTFLEGHKGYSINSPSKCIACGLLIWVEINNTTGTLKLNQIESDIKPVGHSNSPIQFDIQPTSINPARTSHPEIKQVINERRAIKLMNIMFLVIFGFGFGKSCLDDLPCRDWAEFTGQVLTGITLLSAFWFGFCAAKDPSQEKRRLCAKWTNFAIAVIVTVAISVFLCEGDSRNALIKILLTVFVGFPAFINLYVFWRRPAGNQTPK